MTVELQEGFQHVAGFIVVLDDQKLHRSLTRRILPAPSAVIMRLCRLDAFTR
jgi:hypothetical protein